MLDRCPILDASKKALKANNISNIENSSSEKAAPGQNGTPGKRRRNRKQSSQAPLDDQKQPEILSYSIERRGGLTEFTLATRDRLVDAYLKHAGSLARAAHSINVSLPTAKRWRTEHAELDEALKVCDELLIDAVENRLMTKALDPKQHMPAWSIFVLKSKHPDYREKRQPKETGKFSVGDKGTRRA